MIVDDAENNKFCQCMLGNPLAPGSEALTSVERFRLSFQRLVPLYNKQTKEYTHSTRP